MLAAFFPARVQVRCYTSNVVIFFYFLKGLVEVITSSDDHVSVRATILLGELLHMVSATLGNYL